MADEVVVIGAGPAGLATAACLGQKGVPARILEQGTAIGQSWLDYYDRVRLHTGKHLSGLPVWPIPRHYPLYVPRAGVVRYLQDYARHCNIAVSTGERVTRVTHAEEGEHWRVETARGVRVAPAVVVATGSFLHPRHPDFPGRDLFGGQILHACAYRNSSTVTGQRVLVVGLGNTGAEIAVDLANAGRDVALSVRSGVSIVPRDLFHVLPIQYAAYVLRRLPPSVARPIAAALAKQGQRRLAAVGLPWADYLAADRIPVIGLDLVTAIKAGRVTVRGAIDHLSPGMVHFVAGDAAPFDSVVLATGYLPVLSFLQDLAADPATLLPARGVACADWPGLYFVGFHRTTAGMLYTISRHEAPLAAALIAARLGSGDRDTARSRSTTAC